MRYIFFLKKKELWIYSHALDGHDDLDDDDDHHHYHLNSKFKNMWPVDC